MNSTAVRALLLVCLLVLWCGKGISQSHVCTVDSSSAEKIGCINAELKASENELNSVMIRVLKRFDPAQEEKSDGVNPALPATDRKMQQQWDRKAQNLLREFQHAWLRYRNAACKSVRASYEGGTIGAEAFPACLNRLTKGRIEFLKTNFLSED